MDIRPVPPGAASGVTVVGLGPGDLDALPASTRSLLAAPEYSVVVRTLDHPAARSLYEERAVISCDDLYDAADSFEETYQAIVARVIEYAKDGPTIFAVPGSPRVGEFVVPMLAEASAGAGLTLEVVDAQSFVDAVVAAVGIDPLRAGLQILNGHDLPEPLVVDKPTIIAHCDLPVVLADVCSRIDRVVAEGTTATVVVGAGGSDQQLVHAPIGQVDPALAGVRTSLFVDPAPGGLIGAVRTMRRLRAECPWDRKQTHASLVKNLIEETFELVEALTALEPGDWVGYGEVEDELGDVLLQVLFHSAIAREDGAFDIDDVAEALRHKLVRRHPHVFADVVVESAEEVKTNWDRIKAAERSEETVESALDGVPVSMPSLSRAAKIQNRAAKIGFDWPTAEPVLAKLHEEAGELAAALGGESSRVEAELGDLLFTVVNLARHLEVDPEVALRRATAEFERRFRLMEATGPLDGRSLDELDALWEQAKLDRH